MQAANCINLFGLCKFFCAHEMEKRIYTHDINTEYMQSMYVCMCMLNFVCDMNMGIPMRAQTIQERERKSFSFEQLEREAQTL